MNEYRLKMTDKAMRLYLPRDLCRSVGIGPYTPVAIRVEDGRLTLEKAVMACPMTTSRGYQRELALASIASMDADTLDEVRDALIRRAIELANQ